MPHFSIPHTKNESCLTESNLTDRPIFIQEIKYRKKGCRTILQCGSLLFLDHLILISFAPASVGTKRTCPGNYMTVPKGLIINPGPSGFTEPDQVNNEKACSQDQADRVSDRGADSESLFRHHDIGHADA